MYFWNIKGLREKLVDNSLSDKSQMIYLMLTMVTYALSAQISSSEYEGIEYYIETIAILICTVLGVLYCYKGNLTGDGKEFIKRFICISWIVTIRVVVIAVIIIFLILISMFFLNNQLDDSVLDKLFGIPALVAIEVLYFWLMHKHIKFISQNTQKLQ